MRKILMMMAGMVAGAMTLTACSNTTENKAKYTGYAASVDGGDTLDTDGIYLKKDGKMMLCDYETGESMYMCTDANCTHTDESCISYEVGESTEYAVVGEYIYYTLTTEYGMDLKRIKKNGTNDEKLFSIEGVSYGFIVYDEYIVYSEQEIVRNLDASDDDYDGKISGELHLYNMNTNKDKKIMENRNYMEGYSILGEADGKAYIVEMYTAEESEELIPQEIYYEMNIEDGSFDKINIENLDDTYYLYGVSNEKLIFNKDEDDKRTSVNVYSLKDKKIIYTCNADESVNDYRLFGDKLCLIDDDKNTLTYIDIKSSKEKTFKMSKKNKDIANVKIIKDDKMLLEMYDSESGEYVRSIYIDMNKSDGCEYIVDEIGIEINK